jgi:hypothetical protein
VAAAHCGCRHICRRLRCGGGGNARFVNSRPSCPGRRGSPPQARWAQPSCMRSANRSPRWRRMPMLADAFWCRDLPTLSCWTGQWPTWNPRSVGLATSLDACVISSGKVSPDGAPSNSRKRRQGNQRACRRGSNPEGDCPDRRASPCLVPPLITSRSNKYW